jgi:hypothetical protein
VLNKNSDIGGKHNANAISISLDISTVGTDDIPIFSSSSKLLKIFHFMLHNYHLPWKTVPRRHHHRSSSLVCPTHTHTNPYHTSIICAVLHTANSVETYNYSAKCGSYAGNLRPVWLTGSKFNATLIHGTLSSHDVNIGWTSSMETWCWKARGGLSTVDLSSQRLCSASDLRCTGIIYLRKN